MSTPRPPLPAMVVLSVLCPDPEGWGPGLEEELTLRLGPLAHDSGPLPFDQTAYYHREMGGPLFRRLLGFARLAPQEALADIKRYANALEDRLRRPDGARTHNLDPGLLTQERLVLATGKNYAHRVHLGRGIFADLTLVYRGGSWHSLAWTFPDYASAAMREHLDLMRQRYREILFSLAVGQTWDSPRLSRKKD